MIDIELGWVAALVVPRDVAPHPNFWMTDPVTPHGIVALVISAQYDYYARLQDEDRYLEALEKSPSTGALVDAVISAYSVDTIDIGVDQLIELSRSDRESGPRFVATILSGSILCELDRHADARTVLDRAIAEMASATTPSALIARAQLRLRKCLLDWDLGLESDEGARLAQLDLEAAQAMPRPTYLVSELRNNDSALTTERILGSLHESARSHIVNSSHEFNARVAELKHPQSHLVSTAHDRVTKAFERDLEASFSLLSVGLTRTWTFGATDNEGDSDLFRALCLNEYAGTVYTSHYRKLLGMHRLTKGTSANTEFEVREGLRLLRHAGQSKELRKACALVYEQGPLSVLRDEALRVAERRSQAHLVREVEAIVLQYGAPLLGPAAAGSVAEILLEGRHVVPPQQGLNWQRLSTRLEIIWKAIRPLSGVSGLDLHCIEIMLGDILSSDDSGLDHTYSGLLTTWDESAWRTPELQALVASVAETIDSERWPDTSKALAEIARRSSETPVPPKQAPPTNLVEVASVVDDAILGIRDVSPAEQDAAITLLEADLRQTRESAAVQSYSGRGVTPAELAVAFSLVTGRPDLWKSVLDTILDPLVQRDDKSRALERMTRSADRLPDTVTARLKMSASDLLASSVAMFESIDPYPEAIRVLAVVGALTAEEALELTADLVGQRTPEATAAGAITLTTLVRAEIEPQTVMPIVVWLSREPAVRTRAYAAQALAMSAARGRASDLVIRRLRELLQEDGTFVSRAILVELESATAHLPSDVRTMISSISASHPSAQVRSLAARVASAQDAIEGDAEPKSPWRRRRLN